MKTMKKATVLMLLLTAITGAQVARADVVCEDDSAYAIPKGTVIRLIKPVEVPAGLFASRFIDDKTDGFFCDLIMKTIDDHHSRNVHPRPMRVARADAGIVFGESDVLIYLARDRTIGRLDCFLYPAGKTLTIGALKTRTAEFLDIQFKPLSAAECHKPRDAKLFTDIPNPNAVATRGGDSKSNDGREAKTVETDNAGATAGYGQGGGRATAI